MRRSKKNATKMKITKAEQRKQALLNHYSALEKLAILCGINQPNGKKISVALFKLEKIAHKAAENLCNIEMYQVEYDLIIDKVKPKVVELFNHSLQGFFINSDPRGYALKINDAIFKELYRDQTRLTQDVGGYGILSPDLSIESFRN